MQYLKGDLHSFNIFTLWPITASPAANPGLPGLLYSSIRSSRTLGRLTWRGRKSTYFSGGLGQAREVFIGHKIAWRNHHSSARSNSYQRQYDRTRDISLNEDHHWLKQCSLSKTKLWVSFSVPPISKSSHDIIVNSIKRGLKYPRTGFRSYWDVLPKRWKV